MRRALDELLIVGVPTSQPFHRRVMDEPGFASGAYDIGYLDRVGKGVLSAEPDRDAFERVALAAALAEHEARGAATTGGPTTSADTTWVRVARQRGLR
jgi:acetyl/propionyl-CoA carboxylase alpha subunit